MGTMVHESALTWCMVAGIPNRTVDGKGTLFKWHENVHRLHHIPMNSGWDAHTLCFAPFSNNVNANTQKLSSSQMGRKILRHDSVSAPRGPRPSPCCSWRRFECVVIADLVIARLLHPPWGSSTPSCRPLCRTVGLSAEG